MRFFFFQAEDGIRDYKVTGVQTCALPILLETLRGDTATVLDAKGSPVAELGGYQKLEGAAMPAAPAACQPLPQPREQRLACWGDRARKLVPDLTADRIDSSFEIGRAHV